MSYIKNEIRGHLYNADSLIQSGEITQGTDEFAKAKNLFDSSCHALNNETFDYINQEITEMGNSIDGFIAFMEGGL